MANFSEWEIRPLSVDNIKLDPKNPRLPEDIANKSQSTIIAHLIAEEDVLTIAKSIKDNGVFVDKFPIAIYERGKYTIIDGNRRLTALKLLRNPSLAPKRKAKVYELLSKNIDPESIQKINVAIAPSRDDADMRIYLEHAETLSRQWKRLMKHRFIAESILSGKTIEEIAERFSIKASEVKTAATEILLRSLATKLNIEKTVLKKVLHQDFPLSTLTRIIGTKDFSDKTGFRIEGSKIITSIGEESFKNMMKHIFIDLTGNISVDDLKSKKQRTDYINDIYEKSFIRGETGSFEYVPEGGKKESEKEAAPKTKEKKNRKGIDRLIPHDFECMTGLEKLNSLIQEGKSISIGHAKNASGMLLRAILECSIYEIFSMRGKRARILNGDGRIKGLTAIILQLTNQREWFKDKSTLEKFQRFTSSDNPTFVHVETLHQMVHDHHFTPTTEELKQFWKQIMPIVEMCQVAEAQLDSDVETIRTEP